jgi:uncharacterized protein YbcI
VPSLDDGSRGEVAAAISNEMARFHREFYGRGATTVRTIIDRDTVVAVLEDIYTAAERTLIDAGEADTVRQMRIAFQRAMRVRFSEIVEEATGRKVRGFLSQVAFDPDVAVEIFLLEASRRAPA